MEEVGVVIELKGAMALVRMAGGGGCEGCSASGSCKAVSGDRVLEADNKIGARPGQHVLTKIESGAFLKASFIVYMAPVIFLFIGAYIGGKIGPRIYPDLSLDYWQAFLGIIFLGLSILIIRLYDRARKGKLLHPVIVKVLDEGLGGTS